MHELDVQSFLTQPVLDLQHTARISSYDNIWIHGLDILNLPIQKFHGVFVVNHVIDSCAAAAPRGFRQFRDYNTWYGFQELARLNTDFLGVDEVACIVVADPLSLDTGSRR